MREIFSLSIILAIVFSLYSCSTEEIIADSNNADVYQRRTDMLLNVDFTTLFTYTKTGEAQNKLPNAIDSLVDIQQQTMRAHKGTTEAIIKIIVEDGKAIIWEKHFIDAPNKRLAELIRKKEDSHIMYIGSRDNYPAVYRQITKVMANDYNSLGSYEDAATIDALNSYLSNTLKGSNNSKAELRVRITDNSAEVYALR